MDLVAVRSFSNGAPARGCRTLHLHILFDECMRALTHVSTCKVNENETISIMIVFISFSPRQGRLLVLALSYVHLLTSLLRVKDQRRQSRCIAASFFTMLGPLAEGLH